MLLRIGLIGLLLSAALVCAGQAVRPALNGLEVRKGRMIQQAQADALKEATRAQAEAISADKAQAGAKAAFAGNASPGKVKPLSDQLTRADQRAKSAAAQQTQAMTRVTQLHNQMSDWEQKTLKVHNAADGKHKVDWAKGAVVAGP